MLKLKACIKKELLLLSRDKVGLLFMFLMPVVLAILITVVQNSTFDLVNNNKIKLLIENQDSSDLGKKFNDGLKNTGLFRCTYSTGSTGKADLEDRMRESGSVVAILIPPHFGEQVARKTKARSNTILNDLGMETPVDTMSGNETELLIVYDPVLQQSFRYSIKRAIESALQITESDALLESLYTSFDAKKNPPRTTAVETSVKLNETILGGEYTAVIPNATQHNIPAWTIFAMFFVMISLGSSIVKEKLNGSFLRLKTMPVSFELNIISKEITFLLVTVLQAFIIFSVGVFIFPWLGLPPLNLPSNLWTLLLVTVFSGLCAISLAVCLGVFVRTPEQNNGLGAGLVVILAAMGGIIVPYFVLPGIFQDLLNISPMYWCLKGFYAVFLQDGGIKDIFMALLPMLAMIAVLHGLAYWGMKRRQLN